MLKGKSMFTMDNVNEVIALPIVEAKQKALDLVNESNANRGNKARATRSITTARSSVSIAHMMTSFIMAHPENGMKVI